MWFRRIIILSVIAGLVTLGLAVGPTALSQAVSESRAEVALPAPAADESASTKVASEPAEVGAEGPEAPAVAESEVEEVAEERAVSTEAEAARPAAAAGGAFGGTSRRFPSSAGVRPGAAAPAARGKYHIYYPSAPSTAEGLQPGSPQRPVYYYGYYNGPSSAGPLPDPEMKKLLEADFKMDKEARDLVEEYQKASTDKERAELRKKLEELSDKHFDVRQKRRQLEVTRLEERLEQIRQAIEKRNEARELVVRVRVSQLLGDIEWDEWALPGRTRGPEVGLPGTPGLDPTAPSALPPGSASSFSPRRPPPAGSEPAPRVPR